MREYVLDAKVHLIFVRGVLVIVIVLASRRDKSLLYLDLSTDNRLNCPAVFFAPIVMSLFSLVEFLFQPSNCYVWK